MRLVPDGSEQPSETGGLESPSLFADVGDGPAAFELKFLLDEERTQKVEEMARRAMSLDRFADPTRGNSYPTPSAALWKRPFTERGTTVSRPISQL